jgi:hypothetical protein
MSFMLLATIELEKQTIGGRHQVVLLGQVVRGQGHSPCELRDQFRPIPIRQGLEFVEKLLCSWRHEIRVPCCVLRVKAALWPLVARAARAFETAQPFAPDQATTSDSG